MELIARSAGEAAGQLDSHVLNHVVHPLLTALGGVDTTTAVDSIALQSMHPQAVLDGMQAVAQAAPVAMMDPATLSAAHNTAQAAVQQLPDLHSFAVWALDKLAVVQSIDPAAYDSLSHSLNSVVDSLQAAIQAQQAHDAAAGVVPWTNALVLGVQQLVTTLRAPGAGGASMEAMVAAQQAMQTALVGVGAEAGGMARTAGTLIGGGGAVGEMPAGLVGLSQLVFALAAMIVASLPKQDWRHLASAEPQDEVPRRYDTDAINAYFSKRPMVVLQRNTEVVGRLSGFLVSIVADWQLGRWEAMMPQRAHTIRKIVEDLGPAYIKIAQAASTRADIVPQVYADEFSHLHDNVRTFSTVEARKVLEDGLGQPVDTVFEWLSEDPVAAASLGQVYRGKLRREYGGGEVAVKVQRPGALESVALDIFIMRRSATLFSQLPGMSDKWASVLDDWAHRFFLEMDYTLEADNAMRFKQHMAGLSGIKVATVYPQLTSRHIIVTEWIEGERLGDSSAEDVRALCSTLLNCYLIQLLETGFLHADPHPGNLMRTPDGKIVVLDFGLMTEVSEDQRIGLVEYIAHLTAEDWHGVAADLVTLGFLPEGLPDDVVPQMAPVMEKVMGQLVRGGGLRNGFSVTSIATELSGAAMQYQMCVPPYFALVLRAFSVIEGIALKVDPSYAIVQECMPYMSRRLLSDNNPRMRAALRQLLYGKGTRLDVERLNRMLASFSSFTTAAAPSGGADGDGSTVPRLASGPTFSSAMDPAAPRGYGELGMLGALLSGASDEGPILTEPVKEVLKVVFSKDGSYAQEILVDEAVAAIDAMSREAMGEALRLVSATAGTVAAVRGMEALGPLRAMLLPVPLPTDMLRGMASRSSAVPLSADDRAALNTLRAVLELMVPSPGSPAGPGMAVMGVRTAKLAGEVAPLLPELLPGMQLTLERFARQLVRRMALRLAEDLDPAPSGAPPALPPAAQPPQLPAPGTQSLRSGSHHPGGGHHHHSHHKKSSGKQHHKSGHSNGRA